MQRVLVVGAGLIGTSVGLALQQTGEHDVLVHDPDPQHLVVAVQRGAGRPWDGSQTADLVVVAAPPRHTAQVLIDLQSRDVALTYTHTTSFQSQVQAEIEALTSDLSAVVGGHPLAGRETSGPAGASADLFVGRPWAVCPAPTSGAKSAQAVMDLATAVGAEPLVLSPQAHDRAVALLSHLPQVTASALASLLAERADLGLALSGPGLADTTRLAASSPALWTDILVGNRHEVVPVVRELAAVLERLAAALESTSPGSRAADDVTALLRRGNDGRALVPVKRGAGDEGFRAVSVDVDDQPGRLAALLHSAAAVGVNVEDVRVDHVPGRPTGVISLLVATASEAALAVALTAEGWRVQPSTGVCDT